MKNGFLVAGLLACVASLNVPAARADSPDPRGVVEIETSGASDVSLRMIQELADVIDDGATRRLLPIIGKGSLQNLADLRRMRGLDLAILQLDVLDYLNQQRLYPGIDKAFTYVTKLNNEELHILARPDVHSVADLANRKVNLGLRWGGTAITAGRLFAALGIPVQPVNDDQEVALEKLRRGEIAAMAFVVGKPAQLFRSLGRNEGLHLLPVPANAALPAVYLPAQITAEDYPGLVAPDQPVDTIAVGTVLAAARLAPNSARARNLNAFVDAFFSGFPTLLDPGHHPKWQEINLAAELPGWQRLPAAEEWLRRNAASKVSEKDLQATFTRFIDMRQQASGAKALSDAQKLDLFNQFEQWRHGQVR